MTSYPQPPLSAARDSTDVWSNRRENPIGIPSVSVIIAAYTEDRWHDTVEAVTSVLCQSLPPLEVILVIDHNPALARRARAELDGVTILENVGPKGASGARNTGVINSHGEIVVFLDDDAVATPDWLRFLCRHFSEAGVLGVGGGLIPAWPKARPRWFPREFDWVVGGSYTGMPEIAAPIRNVWTGNMAIRRTAFDAVDGFRPGFGKTGGVSRPEDTDLCLRVQRALPSGHWMYDPSAEVAHKVPSDRSTPIFFLTRCWNEGRGKAALVRFIGIDDSTSSERRYATRVLPGAFLRELRSAILSGNVANLERSLAIVAGLVLTAAGLLTEMLVGRKRSVPVRDTQGAVPPTSGDRPDFLKAPPSQEGWRSFRPVCLAEWDILSPFSVAAVHLDELGDHGGIPVRLLVRLGTEPLGYADFESENIDSLPSAAAVSVSLSFRSKINDRLAKSGLPLITEIPVDGLQIDPNQLAFVTEREHLLENAPDISVVVCTRDRPARLADCVRQLARQQYPRYEIVVVDNAPSDRGAVPTVLESLDLPVRVRYVSEPRGGLSWARNAGWRAAGADIIAFLDDDEVADEYWLAELVRGFAARPTVGCVTGMILPAELRTEPQEWFEQFGGHSKGRGFNQEIFEPGHSQSPLYPLPPFGAGGNMAFRREVLVDIDGFQVALGAGTPTMGGEDTFAFTRALLAQHTVVYQSTALIWHNHYDTFAGLTRQLHGYGTGLTAFYAALIAYDPKLILSMLRLIPTAIKDLRGKDSIRTATMRNFPTSLLRTQRRGMREGVPAYVRSVMEQRAKVSLCSERVNRGGG